MMKKVFRLGMVFFALLVLVVISGCSDNDKKHSSDSGMEPLVLGTPSSNMGVTTFRQTVAMEDSDSYEYFPGQANVWDIEADFALSDGGDDQFDSVMYLYVDGTSFSSQSYSDLTFFTPTVNSQNGILVAAADEGPTWFPTIRGIYSAYLNDVYDGRISQTVNLSGATAPVALVWSWNVRVDDGDFGMKNEYIRVVIRNVADGTILQTLQTVASNDTGTYSFNLDAHIGNTVVVSFEISSSDGGPNLIDDVSLTDGSTVEYIVNGDFETGNLTGWSINDPDELQNFTSAEEDIAGLTVTRSFYTVPDKLWGRWVDTFTNNTAGAITTTVEYESNLGSDGAGILYLTPGTGGRSLTGWDGDSSDRDFAFVFGDVDTVDFTTATALEDGNSDGSDDIEHNYSITVNPGEMLSIVNFVVMNGVDTGETAVDVTARATAIDAAALDIVDNFWNDGQYRSGMTQEQIDAIINF